MADSEELRRATHGWSSPLVVRTYDADDRGRRAFEVEARILLVGEGYAPEQQTENGGHIHVGRLVLSGGFSVLAGRRWIRSRGKFTATFRKLTGPPADLIVERATHGRSNLALFEVAGRDVMAGPFPMRLLSGVPRAHAEAVANYLRQEACRVRVEQPGEQAARPADSDFVDQLERLAALHERGVLTDEEFADKKAELLGSDR